jgi:nicotinamidase-related amidase
MAKALLIIDMQMAMQHRIDSGRDHINPDAPARVTALAAAFRRKGLPVIHVRHQDEDPASPFHPAAPGCEPMPCARARDNEPVFVKRTSSAFASTDLRDYLDRTGCTELVVAGAVAGFCVNSTVRAGADLGFRMTVVRDAVLGFDLPAKKMSARSVFDVTMALLGADFAEIVDTSSVLPA